MPHAMASSGETGEGLRADHRETPLVGRRVLRSYMYPETSFGGEYMLIMNRNSNHHTLHVWSHHYPSIMRKVVDKLCAQLLHAIMAARGGGSADASHAPFRVCLALGVLCIWVMCAYVACGMRLRHAQDHSCVTGRANNEPHPKKTI